MKKRMKIDHPKGLYTIRQRGTIMEILELPLSEFVNICECWKADERKNGTWGDKIRDMEAHPQKCPVHLWAAHHGLCKRVTGGTAECSVCGNYICPVCSSHNAEVVSRVTGYLQKVSSWNVAKKQEFKDRKRHGII